ncbi:MAG: ABC transporter permease [Bacteroidota bacterium]
MQPDIRQAPHADFRQLFFRKEGKALMGQRYRNAWILVSILFVTFCAIGFANGSLAYLARKMDDPFINWINLTVPRDRTEEIGDIKEKLNEPKVVEQFGFKNVTGNFSFPLRFYNQSGNNTLSYSYRGRTLELGNPLLGKIMEPSNLLYGEGFSSEKDPGLIVTETMLADRGYAPDASHIVMAYPTAEYEDVAIPVPIVAIVRELPGLSDFASTTFFFRQRMVSVSGSPPYHPSNTKELLLYVDVDEAQANELKQRLDQYVGQAENFRSFSPFAPPPTAFNGAHKPGFLITISLSPMPPEATFRQLYQELQGAESLADFPFLRYFTPSFSNEKENEKYDNLAINFDDLGQIREFKEYCNQEFNLDIDMAQIEARENFNFVSKLTYTISLILIGFSVLSICLFLSSIFRKHLDKIRRNIGTFKAFGLDNGTLMSTYLGMIGIMMTGSIAVSLVLAWIFGSLGGIRLLLRLVQDQLERGQNYFQLFNLWTLIAILAVMGISFLVLYRTASGILNRTPGDLLYDRD